MRASSDGQNQTKKNYFTTEISSKYGDTFHNSSLANEWISSLIYDWLELQPGHTVVDLGCGPGQQSKIIMNKMKNQIRIIGVDPSQGMLDIFRQGFDPNANMETVCMDAVTFSQSTHYSSYDRIFLKTMVHLLTHEERLLAFEGFYKQLAFTDGKLLIVHDFHMKEIVPFDERTKSLFGIVKIETLLDELKHAGFKKIHYETFTYEYPSNTVTAEDWIYILENRLWTKFSEENINEQQMKSLIQHVRRQFESPNNFQTIEKPTILKCYPCNHETQAKRVQTLLLFHSNDARRVFLNPSTLTRLGAAHLSLRRFRNFSRCVQALTRSITH